MTQSTPIMNADFLPGPGVEAEPIDIPLAADAADERGWQG